MINTLMLWAVWGTPITAFIGCLAVGCKANGRNVLATILFYLGAAAALPVAILGLAELLWTSIGQDVWVIYGMEMVGGAIAAIVFIRQVGPFFSNIGHRLTRKTALERSRRTDVREIDDHLPKATKQFDPEKYFRDDRLLIGLNEKRRPVFLDRKAFPKTPHMMVVGTTGGGKGVALGVLVAQWLRQGEAVFFIDPKNDEWAPHVVKQAAERAGVPFYLLDLRPGRPEQINLFQDIDQHDAEELFRSGFGLLTRGEASDYYAIADRRAADMVAAAIAKSGKTPRGVCQELYEELNKTAPKFAGLLAELAKINAVNAVSGLSLADVIEQGGAVYVVGSMRYEEVIRVQKMLLIRLIQLAERRDRVRQSPRPVGIVLDEVKYHLSKTALEALGAARDKGVHVVVTLQSLADLRHCSADLNPDAVEGAFVENCTVKICYRVQDPKTAEWLAEMSGTILVDDEVRRIDTNIGLAETVSGERTIRQAERYYVDRNMLLNMPRGVAAVYGLRLPQFAQICPINAIKTEDNLVLYSAANEKAPDNALIVDVEEEGFL